MKPSLFCGRIRPERPLAVNLSPQYAWTHTGIKLLLPNLPCCSKGKTSVDGSRSLFLACKADAVEPSPVVTTCNRKARGLSGTDVRFTPKRERAVLLDVWWQTRGEDVRFCIVASCSTGEACCFVAATTERKRGQQAPLGRRASTR